MDDGKRDEDGQAPDIQALAKEYVDLWESQIKALAGDEALAKTMAQTMELMNAGAANMAAMMKTAAGTEEADDGTAAGAGDAGDGEGGGRHGAGAEAAGPAPGGSEPDARRLALRVAELEKRIDRLESLIEPTGKRPEKKT